MRLLLAFAASMLLVACSVKQPNIEEDPLTLTSKFKSTWNVHEGLERNSDGTITYNALPWGGLVATVQEHNMPVDLSEYESVTFEFAEPTKVMTQIMISEKLKKTGKPGITSLICEFDGQNVTSVEEIALQAADTATIVVSEVYYTPATSRWEPETIWEGECVFDNWQGGFIVDPDKFESAKAGDKLEFIYHPDTSSPEITYWLFKTVLRDTDITLEGNGKELNQWGCAVVGKEQTDYRVSLTANDVANLRDKGLFVNGYYNIVKKCNLLHKIDIESDDEQN